ncbi:DUF6124 family protein [Pseudomonas fluorescens]|uniref:DUF6124 family protein n=1 Tax=Pseudomonas fluorescens TaxID=294 RepID=UPI000F4A9721|nr:DUF6124 family protein [Pseudomonas fluorescens]RON90448.1 hypothetical protein BK668_12160 [Pseudomonas fluorescens]
MFKHTPNPPESEPEITPERPTDPVSPYAFLDSRKLHDAALRALDHYLLPQPEKQPKPVTQPSTIFTVLPEVDSETLLAHACETLASANVMASELAFTLSGPMCSQLLGIQQMISLAELSVNRVLDQVDPQG